MTLSSFRTKFSNEWNNRIQIAFKKNALSSKPHNLCFKTEPCYNQNHRINQYRNSIWKSCIRVKPDERFLSHSLPSTVIHLWRQTNVFYSIAFNTKDTTSRTPFSTRNSTSHSVTKTPYLYAWHKPDFFFIGKLWIGFHRKTSSIIAAVLKWKCNLLSNITPVISKTPTLQH